MRQQHVPDRDRWIGWVGFAWVLAAVACVAGLYLIIKFGFIEVPSSNRYVTRTEPNVMVWAVTIGQAVGSIMLAVIFHMLHSIYQNSCDQLKSTTYVEAKEENIVVSEQRSGENGVRLTNVSPQSPLVKVLYAGCLVTRFNDETVGSVNDLAARIVKGPNKFEFQSPAGESATKWIHLKPDQPLLVQGELAKIPG